MSGILILGAGGHGKVVADILNACHLEIAGFLDDNPRARSEERLGLPVLGAIDEYRIYAPSGLVLGIGQNHVRQAVVKRLGVTAQDLWINAIHPRATVASSVLLGHGIVVAAHAVVNPDSAIGSHVIINTGATIDHECSINDYAHVAPGSHLAGNVVVETGAFLGVGASVIPGLTIGEWSIVGAGSVVLRDIPARATAYGVPAKVVKNKNL